MLMPGPLSVISTAAAMLALTTLGLPAAIAAPTADTDITSARGWGVARPTRARQ